MSLFGGGGHTTPLAQAKPSLHALRIQTSAQGQSIPLVFGLNRVPLKLIDYGDFTPVPHTSTSSSSGGKGGGGQTTTTSTTYTYTASVIGLICEGPITGAMGVFDTKGNKSSNSVVTNGTIPGSPFQVAIGGLFLADLGALLGVAFSDNYNDFGSDTYNHGGTNKSGTDYVPMVKVGSSPTAGQYSVDSAGVYTFAAADAGKLYRIKTLGKPATGNTPVQTFGWTIFNGAVGQAAWSYWATAHPSRSLGYSGVAYAGQANMDLGSTGELRNWNFEILGGVYFAGGGGDALPGDVVDYLFRNHTDFPIAQLDRSLWDTHNKAYGLLLSPVYEEQSAVSDLLDELCSLTNSAPITSGGVLKIIPYTDTSQRGNGALYTPPTAPIVDFTDDDFIADSGSDPVVITRAPKADGYNSVKIEYANRANSYNPDVVENKDQAQIDTYGPRPADVIKSTAVCDKQVATTIADFKLKRFLYIDGGVKVVFKVSWRYFYLDPMDLVTVTDAALGWTKHPVRIVTTNEDKDGNFDIEAEDFPWGTATATLYPKADGINGYIPQTQADPGACGTPFLFEPPARATEDGLGNVVWIGACSATQSPDYGGCNIYISEDNANFRLAGTIYGKTRMGVIAAASSLPQVADPDTTSTMKVDMTQSGATLVGGSQTDVDQLHTLMYVNGELVAFRDAALVSTSVYNLSYFRRGAYGSPLLAHAAAEQVVRIDSAVFSLKYDPLDIGKTVYVKCVAFNTFGNQAQQLSAVTATSYVLGGTGAGLPNFVHDALVLEGNCALSTGTLAVQVSNVAYTIVSKDMLEYDVYLDPSNPDFFAGLNIVFTDVTDLATYKDQNLLNTAYTTDLSKFCKGQWYHRKVDLTRAAGKVTAQTIIGLQTSAVGQHRAKFANVKITNGTTVKATLWAGAPPVISTIITNVNYSAPKLYTQNDGGSWYALLISGTSTGMNLQGSIIPTPSSATPFAYVTQDDGSSYPCIIWRWVDITAYRPDGSTFVINRSQYQWSAVPLAPVLSQAAGGARAAATLFARVAYCKGGAIVGIGKQSSLAVLINNTVSIAAPGNPTPRSSGVVLSDTFAGVSGTLLSAHAADTALGAGNGVGNVYLRTITANDFKLNGSGKIQLTTASTSQAAYIHDARPQQDGYTALVDIDFSASAANGDFGGLQVRAQDGNNYYFISVRGDGKMRIEKKIASVVTVIQADTAISLKVGTMKVVVTTPSANNTQMDCYWNNVLVFSKVDSARKWTYGEGVGISSGSVAVMTFANFSVNDGITVGNPVASYEGWVPLVGTATGFEVCQVDPRTPLAFNVGWTEPTAGATHVATLVTGNTNGPDFNAATDLLAAGTAALFVFTGAMSFGVKGDTGGLLVAATTYRFYPGIGTMDTNKMVQMLGGAYPSVVDVQKNALMLGDQFVALANSGGMSVVTAAIGGGGSGGGGGCPAEDHIIFCESCSILGVPFNNSEWIVVRTKNGGKAKVTPRQRFTTRHGLIPAHLLVPEIDEIWTKRRKDGVYEFSTVCCADPLKEVGRAMNVVVPTVDKLHFMGAPDSEADLEGHNLKP